MWGSAACLPANRVGLRCCVCLLMDLKRKRVVSHGCSCAWRLDPVSRLLVCNPVSMLRNHELMLTQAQPILDKAHLPLKLGHLEAHTTLGLLYQLVKDYSRH